MSRGVQVFMAHPLWCFDPEGQRERAATHSTRPLCGCSVGRRPGGSNWTSVQQHVTEHLRAVVRHQMTSIRPWVWAGKMTAGKGATDMIVGAAQQRRSVLR